MPIFDIFKNRINREINGVIKVGAREEAVVQTEIEEYVVTKEINRNMQKMFSNYAESFNSQTQDIGVWISGFFGSGKSHMLKMIGTILENGNYGGKSVADYFDEKLGDDRLLFGNLKKASEIKTDVILFDIGKISDQDSLSSSVSIITAFQKKFNEYVGFIRDDLKLAEFERFLWRENKYDEFKELYKEETTYNWVDDRKNFDFRQTAFLEVIDKLNLSGFDEDAAERWLEQEKTISISAESFTELLIEYLDRIEDKRRIVFLVDEIGQYIGNSSTLMLNLQGVVEEIGQKIKGRVWVMVTSQQGITEIINEKEMKIQEFSRIQDRFKTRLPLSSSNVDEVIKKRLLEKNENVKAGLKSFYEDNRINIENLITFEKNDAQLNLYKDADEFVDSYPFVPYQFNLLQKVFEKIRKMSHSGQHQSKGERSLLNAFHEAGNKVVDKEIGIIVPFNAFYESIEQFLEDTVRRPVIHAKEQLGMEEFDVEVLKLLFLLKGLDIIKSNIDNIASFMINSVDNNRVDIKVKVDKALKRLEKECLIQRNGDEFFFLTDDEQDVNREIKEIKVDTGEILRQINSQIFDGILDTSKVKVKATDNTYNLGKKIDEQIFSNSNGRLLIHLMTPYHDENKDDVRVKLYTQRDPYTLFVRMSETDNYMNEIREYIQIDRYVSNKMATNPPESIIRILQMKQGEKRGRAARIKDYLIKALENARFYMNGNELDIQAKSAKERMGEALETYALNVYRNSVLVKHHYDEKKIKTILSYEYSQSLFANEKELINNPNFEAIKEVENYMRDLTDRFDVINMKKLVDKFSDIHYGWRELDIQGIITELFAISRVTIKFDGEELDIENKKNAADVLIYAKASNQEKLIILPKGEKPVELIKKAISLLKQLYGANTIIDENRFEREAKDLLTGKMNLAVKCLSNYRGNFKFVYPGKSEIEEYKEFIEDLLMDSKNEKELCNNIINQFDEFEELRDDADTVFDFFDINKTKKQLFESGVKVLDDLERNEINYIELKNHSASKAIEEILRTKKPYGELYKITDYISAIQKEIEVIVSKEKENLLNTISEIEKKDAERFKDNKTLLEMAEIEYGNLKELCEKSKDEKVFQLSRHITHIENKIKEEYIKTITRDIRKFEGEAVLAFKDKENGEDSIREITSVYNKMISKISGAGSFEEIQREYQIAEDEKQNWINVSAGKEKKKERVAIKIGRVETRCIETKEQVEEYIAKYEKELNDTKEKMLRAIEENKRIDIY